MIPSQTEVPDTHAGEDAFEPFDLTIHLGPDAVPWLSASSRVGFLHGIPRRPEGFPSLMDLLDLVYDYTDAVQFAEAQPAPALAEILGDLVFGDPMVLQLFQATRGVAADRGRQLLVRILASPHLAVLPWELLPDPAATQSGQGYRYLALAPDAHLTRLARGRTYSARGTVLPAPLNLLIVLSSPTPRDASEDWLAFDLFAVKRSLLAELAPLEQAGLLCIDVEDRPTLDNLRRRIGAQRRGYHLFHYVGHALPDRLILEDRSGRREDLPSSQFVELLRLCPDLRLAVFAGCETARAAGDPALLDARHTVGWRDLLSLADYCVQQACPSVVGMQAVLPFGTERVFTRFFYQGLANGYSTAEALRLARGAIQADTRPGGDLLDWSVPVLFLGHQTPGALVPRAAPVVPPPRQARIELKLGLRQGTERFLARELALRQAVDILAGHTVERALIVTGGAGVGKTALIDRALEELGPAASHVLYVHFNRLSPAIAQARNTFGTGGMPELAVLHALAADHALENLCRFSNELLRLAGLATRGRDPAWSIEEWWERIVEDLVAHKLVLVIDEIGMIDQVQRALIDALIRDWLGRRVADEQGKTSIEHLLETQQQLLSRLQEALERRGTTGGGASDWLESVPAELRQELTPMPARLRGDATQVFASFLEDLVVRLSAQRPSAEQPRDATAVPDQPRFAEALKALNALERVRDVLGRALSLLIERRSPVRVVLAATDKLSGLLDVSGDQVFEMRLAQLTWPETWRWIRRNLPTLVSYGEVYLSRIWLRFGAQLDAWEELEQRVLSAHGTAVDVQALAAQISPSVLATSVRHRVPGTRRGGRVLRIAVAGPHLAGASAMAEAFTRLAIEHGIGGRVVLDAGEQGALAALIDVPSPFAGSATTTQAEILAWLQRVFTQQPDIILLDYGASHPPSYVQGPRMNNPERRLLRSVHYRSLLVAAGGNDGGSQWVTTPAAYPEVLGIGPLDDELALRPYASWHPALGKPDLFIADNLAGTALAAALSADALAQGTNGSSFAALHAVAAAALVWSILPELSPRGVRALLIDASKPAAGAPKARALILAEAVSLARRRVVDRTLRAGPSSINTLAAITGLETATLAATLDALMADGQVRRSTAGRLERYHLIGT